MKVFTFRFAHCWVSGVVGLVLLLLGLGLAGCLPSDDSSGRTESGQTSVAAGEGQSLEKAKSASVAPRGAPGGERVLQRLRENHQLQDNQAADAEAIASGQPPATVSSFLAAQSLDQPSESGRRRAVEIVALQRSNDATDLLLATATDPAPAVRRKSVEALWVSAKDLPDRAGDIERALRDATNDTAPGVAEVAHRALTDLERQRQRNSGWPAPVPDRSGRGAE